MPSGQSPLLSLTVFSPEPSTNFTLNVTLFSCSAWILLS
jgi:hypothetical protein